MLRSMLFRPSFKLTLAGMAVSVMAGSGLFALGTDTVTSPNSIDSGTYAASHDVRLARINTQDASCPTDAASYQSNATTLQAFSNTGPLVSLADNGQSLSQATDFCVRNFGSAAGSLAFRALSNGGVELGCAVGEAAVDPDCAGAGSGDLSPVLQVSVSSLDQACGSLANQPLVTTATPPTAQAASLAAGASCRIYTQVGVSSAATQNQRLAAQTDRQNFLLEWTLRDGAPE